MSKNSQKTLADETDQLVHQIVNEGLDGVIEIQVAPGTQPGDLIRLPRGIPHGLRGRMAQQFCANCCGRLERAPALPL